MRKVERLEGVIPALITPFTESGRVNGNALIDLMKWNLGQGAVSFFIGGSSAECFLMTPSERIEAMEIAAQMKDDAYLIAHVGAISTDIAIDYAKHAVDLGYDAIAATPPFYYGFGPKEIYQYYYDLAQAAGKPVLVYNFPGNTGKNFDLENPIYRKMFTSDFILGVKHTNQIVYQLERFKAMNPNLIMMNGFDETSIAAYALGCEGSIGSTFNFMYYHYEAIREAFYAGKVEEARELQHRANNIMNALVNVGLFPAIKYILNEWGFDAGSPRRPFFPLDDASKTVVDTALAQNLLRKPE